MLTMVVHDRTPFIFHQFLLLPISLLTNTLPAPFASYSLVHHAREVHERDERGVQGHKYYEGRYLREPRPLLGYAEAHPHDVAPYYYSEEEEKCGRVYHRVRVDARVEEEGAVCCEHSTQPARHVQEVAQVHPDDARDHEHPEELDDE